MSELASNFVIGIVCIDEVYVALKKNNLLPEKYVYEGQNKISVFKKD